MPDAPRRLELLALPGMPEVDASTDLADVVLAAVRQAGTDLLDGDVLVVSSKVISKAMGLVVDGGDRDAVVTDQSVRVVAERRTPHGLSQVVEAVAGPVMAAAGVDASNTAAGTLLTLPPDPDAAARALRRRLRAAGAPRVAVVVSDTAGRAWRRGQSDLALGVAGLVVVDDLRGTTDAGGQLLEVTERAVADEVAAAADLVKGKASATPVALVRGLAELVTDDDGPGAAALLRAAATDWFRYGHVEAVRRALGVPQGAVEPGSVVPEPLRHKVERAIEVTLYDGSPVVVEVRGDAGSGGTTVDVVVTGGAYACGVAAQRLLLALWAEDLGAVPAPPAPTVAETVTVSVTVTTS